jgi:hypothetical protein
MVNAYTPYHPDSIQPDWAYIMLTRCARSSPLRTLIPHRAVSKRFKATISDLELDQRYGHGPGEPYNKMEYKFGMPTPPLSPKLGQKSMSPLQSVV